MDRYYRESYLYLNMEEKKIDWRECCKRKIAKEVSADENLINSLIKASENKLKSSEELTMNDTNAVSKVSLIYDSIKCLFFLNFNKIFKFFCFFLFFKN